MSTLLHCDAPDCDRTAHEASSTTWFTVEHEVMRLSSNRGVWNFCSKRCLAVWATKDSVPTMPKAAAR